MRRIILSLVVMMIVSVTNVVAQSPADSMAIKQAALDYIEGWYTGDAERMEKALHPDLAKRVVRTHPKTGKSIVNHLSAAMMVEYTRGGGGTATPKEKQKSEVIILDISREIASAKSISGEYIDYLHIAKVNGQWKLINVLWEPAEPPKQ